MPVKTDAKGSQKPYDPNRLLDALKEMLQLDSDVALSHTLEVPEALISQIRYRNYPVGPSILIRMHEASDLSVRELREIMGDRRNKIRTSYDENFLFQAAFDGTLRDDQFGVSRRFWFLALTAIMLYVLWSRIP